MSVDHYENFPVASLLCPPALREPITAIYHFARTADDLADEGDAPAEQRLADLALYRADLQSALAQRQHSGRWPGVFGPLPGVVERFSLPVALLMDLLSAFEQDVRFTAEGLHYADHAALLDYCRRSANPIGRLLLHLYRIDDPVSLARSDAICSALQLINFWQDLSVDTPRRRFYLPVTACAAHGIRPDSLVGGNNSLITSKIIAEESILAGATMLKGQELAKTIPGRAGWELRLVIQGGLRVLDKMAAMNHGTLHQRPRLRWHDLPVMVWRALRM